MRIVRSAPLLFLFAGVVAFDLVASLLRPTPAHAAPSGSTYEAFTSDGGLIQIEILDDGLTADSSLSFKAQSFTCPVDAYVQSITLGGDDRTLRVHQKIAGN